MKNVIIPCILLLSSTAILSSEHRSDGDSPLILADVLAYIGKDYPHVFSVQEKECLKELKVLYNGSCYYHAYKFENPCREDEMLVYDKQRAQKGDGALKTICQRKPCPRDYFYFTSHKKCYHEDEQDDAICPEPSRLGYDLFGERYCKCSRGQARLLGNKTNQCYTLFEQGFCEPGSYFLPINDFIKFGYGKCERSPCYKKNHRMVEVHFEDGQKGCYDFDTQGPCQGKQGFSLYSWYGLTYFVCAGPGGAGGGIAVTLKGTDCVENDDGECLKPLKYKPLDPYEFYLD